ncbi:MAG: hypothetical protein F6K41_10135 [Symploca sp. SIO3E6]|nr:hypothetical protein [Caldora sp. SIO3E6]
MRVLQIPDFFKKSGISTLPVSLSYCYCYGVVVMVVVVRSRRSRYGSIGNGG